MSVDVENSMTRFRSEKSLQFQYMLANVERYLYMGAFKFMRGGSVLDFVCCLNTPDEVRRGLSSALQSPKPFLCVNDDIKDPRPEHGVIIHSFFEALVGRNVTANSMELEKTPECIGSEIESALTLPEKAYEIPNHLQGLLSEVTVKKRDYFLSNPDSRKPEELTAMIEHIDDVDLDNSISDNITQLPKLGDVIKIAELNAERGRYWCEFTRQIMESPELKNIDIWLLNEFGKFLWCMTLRMKKPRFPLT